METAARAIGERVWEMVEEEDDTGAVMSFSDRIGLVPAAKEQSASSSIKDLNAMCIIVNGDANGLVVLGVCGWMVQSCHRGTLIHLFFHVLRLSKSLRRIKYRFSCTVARRTRADPAIGTYGYLGRQSRGGTRAHHIY